MRNKADPAWTGTVVFFMNSLSRTCGMGKCLWPYLQVEPTLPVEELFFPENRSKVPAGWKVHCANGAVSFVQYIVGRGESPVDAIFDRDEKSIDVGFDERSGKVAEIAIPPNWAETIENVERLAADWKYVHVDCFRENSRRCIGELIFHPRSRCYKGKEQRVLGELLTFDTSTFKEPIDSPSVNPLVDKTKGLKRWFQFTLALEQNTTKLFTGRHKRLLQRSQI